MLDALGPAGFGAVLTLVAALSGSGALLIRGWIDRRPNATDVRAADSNANDLILKLLARADAQVERDAKTIERQESTITELKKLLGARLDDADRDAIQSLLDNTREALTQAQEDLTLSREEAARLRLAILHLRRLAEGGATFTGRDVIVWANNALDLNVPLQDIVHLPDDFDTTEYPVTRRSSS